MYLTNSYEKRNWKGQFLTKKAWDTHNLRMWLGMMKKLVNIEKIGLWIFFVVLDGAAVEPLSH